MNIYFLLYFRFAIPISSSIFTSTTGVNAAIATGTPITTVTGVTGKDVQPKSPGANDEDDDEGMPYYEKL